jgi:predicted dehydrogenase
LESITVVLPIEGRSASRIEHLFADHATSQRPGRGATLSQPGTAGTAPVTAPVGVGVIGYGYWGPNLVRNFAELPGARVVAVSDLNTSRLASVQARYPSVETTTDYQDLLANPSIGAIAISTPVSTHYPLAKEALAAGKHVLVEKPLAMSVADASALIEQAEQRGLVLMVDHTFVYTGAVQKMKELIDDGRLGRLYYYDSTRVNLGLFQHDVDVLWDLAVHDLAIMDYLIGRQPDAVSATGVAHVPGKPINIGYLTCFFEDNLIAHINANWLAPVKVRRTLVGGDNTMIVYDDLEPSEKVKVYDRGIALRNGEAGPGGFYDLMVSYRTGDMWAPKLSMTEALNVEARHFLECILEGRRPITDGRAGRRVVKILAAAAQSLSEGGRAITLEREKVPS